MEIHERHSKQLCWYQDAIWMLFTFLLKKKKRPSLSTILLKPFLTGRNPEQDQTRMWGGKMFTCSFSHIASVFHPPSRSQLLRECIAHSGDSRGGAHLDRLLHKVPLSRWPGRGLLGGKPSRHLLPPQKLQPRRDVPPRKSDCAVKQALAWRAVCCKTSLECIR